MLQDDSFNIDIAQAYQYRQPYQDLAQPPVMLSFSAIPGSGKTTLAKKLFHDLRTQYVNHDDIRAIIKKRGIDPEELFIPPISKIVVKNMILHDMNKFVILDVSLDRRWDIFFDHAHELKAQTFVIRLNPSLEVIKERLRLRNGENSLLLNQMDRFKSEFNNCCQNVKADITVGENYDYEDVLNIVKSKLYDTSRS